MTSTNNDSKKVKEITPEDLYALKQITEVALRPNSADAYYVITQANKEENNYRKVIWQYKDEPKQFSQGLPSDWSIKWSNDGKKLAFISVRQSLGAQKGNNNQQPPKPQIYLISPDGGEAIQLTNVENGVSSFEWSNDDSKIIFCSGLNENELHDPKKEELKEMLPEEKQLFNIEKKKREKEKTEPREITRMIYRAGTSFLDDRRQQVFVIDIKEKEVDRWTEAIDIDYPQAFLTPDNKYAIGVRQKPGLGDETRIHEFVKITPDKKIEIIVDDHFGWGAGFKLSPDGKYIATHLGDREKGTLAIAKLCIYSTKDGKRKILADDIDNPKMGIRWSDDSKYLYFLVFEKGNSTIWRVNVKTDETEQIVKGDRVIANYDLSKDSEWLLYSAFHVNDPSKLYRYNISKKKEELLVEPNKKVLEKRKLGKTEEVWYDGYNGDFKIQGWILTPPNFDPEEEYPLALNMHGGPHVMWSQHQSIPMFHEFQTLASQGYVVFYCNPRGSAGYGSEFQAAIEKEWGEKDSFDILNGVDLVVDKYNIDTKRMGITGGSYAGFLTAWIVGHDDRFAAAVSQRGVYALPFFWGTSDAKILIDDEFGTTALEDIEFLWKRSPAAYAQNITTPLCLIHSELDFRVPIPDAEMLYTAVKRANPDLPVELVRYPEEGHELSRSGKPTRRINRLEKIVSWFNKYCQEKKTKEQNKKKEKIKKVKEKYFQKMRKEIKKIEE
jgi:dipeptidyl aminopeptidase/acylaminoacyl peptidase